MYICLKVMRSVCRCCTVAARLVAKSEVYCYGQRLPITSWTSVASLLALEGCQRENSLVSAAASELPIDHPSLQGSSIVVESPDAIEVSDSDDDNDDDDDDYDDVLCSDADVTVKDVVTATCATRRRCHDSDVFVADCVELSDNVESLSSDLSAPLSLASEGWQRETISDSAAASQSSVDHTSRTVTPAALDVIEVSDDNNDAVLTLDADATAWWKDIATETYPLRCDSELCVVKLLATAGPSSSNSLPPLQRSQSCPDCNADEELAETDDICKLSDDDSKDDNGGGLLICNHDVLENDSEMSVCLQKSQCLSELVREQYQRNVELDLSSSRQTRKLCFSEEKLCLLDKIITAGNVELPCTLRVAMAEKAVELAAADEEVVEAEIKLYELIANFSSVRPHLPAGVVKLLLSGRGQSWLRFQLASFCAVFHAVDSASPCIVAIDCSTSADVKFLLETSLSSRTLPFDDEHLTFLRSAQWHDAVDKLESEYFVAVTTDCRERGIVLEGSVEALNDVGQKVETLLRQNSRVQRKITMTPEHFQLLLHFRVEINDRLKSEAFQHQQHRCVYTAAMF